jgi:sister chromatid cohesion protein DCC1
MKLHDPAKPSTRNICLQGSPRKQQSLCPGIRIGIANMSTQYDVDIPFSANHNQQAFKLLELPPELLALLESDNAPSYAVLSIVLRYTRLIIRRITINSSPATATTPGYAILSAADKRYQMRQKNTSNPIMILQPSSTFPTEADDAATFIPAPSVTTISKIEDTIELIVQEAETKAPPKVNKWHEKFAKSRAEKKS